MQSIFVVIKMALLENMILFKSIKIYLFHQFTPIY